MISIDASEEQTLLDDLRELWDDLAARFNLEWFHCISLPGQGVHRGLAVVLTPEEGRQASNLSGKQP